MDPSSYMIVVLIREECEHRKVQREDDVKTPGRGQPSASQREKSGRDLSRNPQKEVILP